MSSFTRDNYQKLLAYRNEGLRKAGARFVDELERPKSRCFFPILWDATRETAYPSVSLGPWQISVAGPSMILADEALSNRSSIKILDIGCANGAFRDFLRLRNAPREVEYIGVDVDPVAHDFPIYRTIGDVAARDFDLVFMSEVAEHMPADVFADCILRYVPQFLKPGGIAIVGVPNPLAPTILPRDVTHVQHYPWFDLYAMLRFFFDDVTVLRTHLIHTPRRFLCYPFTRVLSYLLEVDWCEGLTLVAAHPRRGDAGSA